jgi:acyl-CoA synthetase (AMP-forming)/AMP-acid ligase II
MAAESMNLDECFGRTIDISFEPLRETSHQELAARWQTLGLRSGDLVILSMPTSVALLRHFFGVVEAGGVPVLTAPGTRSIRLKELSEAMGARAIAAPALPAIGAPRLEKVGLLEAAIFETVGPAAEPGDVVLLTSGTSGASSGCLTSIAAMSRNALRHCDAIGQRPTDTVLVSLPLHFSFALVAQALGTFLRGGRLVIAGPPFLPDRYAKAIESSGVTVSALSPTQVRTLLQNGAKIPPELRTLSVGGDSLAPEHVADLLRARPERELYLTYGLTQAGPRVSTLAAHSEPEKRFASVGLPLSGTTVELEPIADGRTEMIVHADTVMKRWVGVVEGRRQNELRAPGVLATGDLFDRDEDGYLFYRGRISEYIQRAGEKICIATVKRLATKLAGVVAARTVITKTADGEDYDLLLVAADGASPDPDACRKALGHATRPAELPRAIEIIRSDDPRLGHK